MSNKLQTVFQAVIKVVNYAKISPLRGRHFTNLCWYGGRTHGSPHYCETSWLFCAKALRWVFEMKEERAISLHDSRTMMILFRNWPIWWTFLETK